MSDDNCRSSEPPFEAPNDNKPKRSLLQTLVEEYRLPVGLIIGAIAVTPNLVSVPVVTRYEVWEACGIFAICVCVAHFSRSRVPLAAVACVLTIAMAVIDMEGQRRQDRENSAAKSTKPTGRRHVATVASVGEAPVASIVAFNKRWVLHSDGDLDRISLRGDLETTYRIRGPSKDLVACGGALILTHDSGKVARVDPVTGTVKVDYPYATTSGLLACGGGYVWATKLEKGSVVQLKAGSLAYVDEYTLGQAATSITWGAGVLWMLDSVEGFVVGVRARTKEEIGPFPLGIGAQQIVFANGWIWVLDVQHSCLKHLSVARPVESAGGVPLGPSPGHLHAHDDMLYVTDLSTGAIIIVDAETGHQAQRPVLVPNASRVVDADAFGLRLSAIDQVHHRVVTMGTDQIRRHTRAHPYRRQPGCPPG
jgi:multidrug transporter EmrE-like cation transporter